MRSRCLGMRRRWRLTDRFWTFRRSLRPKSCRRRGRSWSSSWLPWFEDDRYALSSDRSAAARAAWGYDEASGGGGRPPDDHYCDGPGGCAGGAGGLSLVFKRALRDRRASELLGG